VTRWRQLQVGRRQEWGDHISCLPAARIQGIAACPHHGWQDMYRLLDDACAVARACHHNSMQDVCCRQRCVPFLLTHCSLPAAVCKETENALLKAIEDLRFLDDTSGVPASPRACACQPCFSASEGQQPLSVFSCMRDCLSLLCACRAPGGGVGPHVRAEDHRCGR
jgi:hypothetical protein